MPTQKDHSGLGVDLSTPIAAEPPDLPENVLGIVHAGILAFRRIDKGAHRADWLAIGRTLNALQAEALRAAGTNQPVGARYNAVWAHYVRKQRLTTMVEKLDKPTKAHAMWMARNWEQVEPWLAKMPDKERNRQNNPTAIKRRFDRDHSPHEHDDLEKPQTVHERLALTREQLRHANKTLESFEQDGPLKLGLMTPEEIADLIVDERPLEVDQVILALQLRQEMQRRRAQSVTKPDGQAQPDAGTDDGGPF